VLIERKYQTFWPRWADGLAFLPIVVATFLRTVTKCRSGFGLSGTSPLFCLFRLCSPHACTVRPNTWQDGNPRQSLRHFRVETFRPPTLMREIVPNVLIVAEVAFGLPGVLQGPNPTRPPHPEVLGVEF
jgi:hypothetical protein